MNFSKISHITVISICKNKFKKINFFPIKNQNITHIGIGQHENNNISFFFQIQKILKYNKKSKTLFDHVPPEKKTKLMHSDNKDVKKKTRKSL